MNRISAFWKWCQYTAYSSCWAVSHGADSAYARAQRGAASVVRAG
jgi:hypothetical protein